MEIDKGIQNIDKGGQLQKHAENKADPVEIGGRKWEKLSNGEKGVQIAKWAALALAMVSAIAAAILLAPALAVPVALVQTIIIISALSSGIAVAMEIALSVIKQKTRKENGKCDNEAKDNQAEAPLEEIKRLKKEIEELKKDKHEADNIIDRLDKKNAELKKELPPKTGR